MSLQTKIFLFFTISVVLPLGVAGFLSERAVTHALETQDRNRVILSTPAVVSGYAARLAAIPDAVSAVGSDSALTSDLLKGDKADLESVLRRDLAQHAGTLDFAVVTDATGTVLAAVPGSPDYLPGFKPFNISDLLAAGPVPVLRATADAQVVTQTTTGVAPASLRISRVGLRVLSGTPPAPVGAVVAGIYLDNHLAQRLAAGTGNDVTIVVNHQAVGSSMIVPRGSAPWTVAYRATPGKAVRTHIDGRLVDALVSPLIQGLPLSTAGLVTSTLPVSQSTRQALVISILVVLGLAAAGTTAVGFAVSRAIARPLRELADGADAISAGHFDARIGVRSGDEVGQLAQAFNQMAERLAVQVAELHGSREELKRSLTRFGETLRSTHDLNKILQVVLDTSVDALRARAGIIMVVESTPPAASGPARLRVAASRGLDTKGLTLRVGEGIAGMVAANGEPVTVPARLRDGDDLTLGARRVEPDPDPSPLELLVRTGIWVPVFAQGRIFAVLSVFDREDGAPFTSGDLDPVLSLANQAGVAIDNVALHEEAQRLAITDSMTGIWNHRYFQMRFTQEMDRAVRFRRPFCVLLCDIDNFKQINDSLGHQVGDEVLIELARRIRSEVRDIDVLARYGGEEFVLMLPETDAEGALLVGEKIRRRVADGPFGPDRQLRVTISIGAATFPRAGTDTSALLRAADVALYQAKAQGKNRTVIFLPPELGAGAEAGAEAVD